MSSKLSTLLSLFFLISIFLFINIQKNPEPIKIADKVITLPEALTNEQFADIFIQSYPDFDKVSFIEQASSSQGYLFPDTYFFASSSTKPAVLRLRQTFEEKTSVLQEEALSQDKKWSDIVIMASILEEEAKGPEDFGIVAGILWKRISIGMALQVDVATTTYKMRGLPEEPISNPGLAALDAALNPTLSNYLYYLTGNDGLMHYAKTFDEHKSNIQKYLR